MTIESFRAYRKRQDFELGDAVTVLYGPNGFGKTSFFDAVDFAATGGVGRLGLLSNTDRFARAVGHLDGRLEDASVGLNFGMNGSRRKITRRVASRAKALIDGSAYDRKSALVEITGSGLGASDRVEHLERLFRATHIFGQGAPELARGFDRDCVLPAQVVAHMLAFDDYASARSKASEVCDILDRALRDAAENARVLRRQIEEAELGIGNLKQVSTKYDHAASPKEALAALRRRVQDAGLSVATGETEHVFVRASRAAVQASLADGEARIRRLTALVEEVRALPGVEEGLAEFAKRRDRAEGELRSATEAFEQAKIAHGKAVALLRGLRAKRAEARTRADAVRWARETEPRFRELLRLEAEWGGALRNARTTLEERRERRRVAARQLRVTEQGAERSSPRLARARDLVARMGKLVDGAESWRRDVAAVQRAASREETLREELGGLGDRERTLAGRLRQSRAERARIDAKLRDVEREQSEFSGLLGRLEEYIRDGLCPLCGHDFGSLEVLLERVERQRARDAGLELRRELAMAGESEEKLERQLSEVRETATEREREAKELRSQRQEATAHIAEFEGVLTEVGFSVQEPSKAIEEINERWVQERANISELERTDAALKMELEGRRTAVADVAQEVQEGERAVSEAERELRDCQARVERLRADDRAVTASLDTEAGTLREVEARRVEELKEVDLAVLDAVGAAREKSAEVDRLREEVSGRAAALDGVKEEVGARRRAAAETAARLAEFDLVVGTEYGEVAQLLEEEAKTRSRLAELLDFADSVEVAMDAATTAAALRQHAQAIRERKRRVEDTKQDIERYGSWRRYFGELAEKLAGEQRAAVANFAENYGPTASAIQERLRSVYGFGGIDTGSHDATIRVRVRRGKDVLRPTDYFSDSQQRTLLLGLFLTASISQSWSSLSTVLLDDPIMHFDDLNTYAFLDMVAGFLDARSGPRQFIMSTCDRKVMQLARKRFRHLGREARFYEFCAIGRDGPVVKEVTAG